MPKFSETQYATAAGSDLVDAIRREDDLSPEAWHQLWSAASPYQRRVARMLADPTVAPHGLPSTYNNYGCRCDLCRLGYAESKRKRSTDADFKDDAPPTDRDPTVQALYARSQGWDLTPAALELLAAYDAEQVL